MESAPNRRDFLKTLAAGAAGLSLTPQAFADENIIHITAAGSNVLLLVTPDGLLAVDGGLTVGPRAAWEESAALENWLRIGMDPERVRMLLGAKDA